jgi:NAD(P)-dependent dehydrogenase (short-subunit alcohol dehydrogenase family)
MGTRLTDKVAIITGGAGGIGLATGKRFLEEGARGVVLVDRDEGELREAASSLGAADRVQVVAADVSEPASAERCVAAAEERFGGLDVMMANAGIEGPVRPLTDYSVEDFDRVLAVNVRGVFLGVKASVPALKARGGGSILITSSVAGLVGAAGLIGYAASKHAVNGIAKTAAIELAPLGIRVNTIHPGPIENRMMRSIEEQASPGHGEQVKAKYSDMIPMRRYGTNEEIANAAVYLASGESSYVTGTMIVLDGGMTAS